MTGSRTSRRGVARRMKTLPLSCRRLAPFCHLRTRPGMGAIRTCRFVRPPERGARIERPLGDRLSRRRRPGRRRAGAVPDRRHAGARRRCGQPRRARHTRQAGTTRSRNAPASFSIPRGCRTTGTASTISGSIRWARPPAPRSRAARWVCGTISGWRKSRPTAIVSFALQWARTLPTVHLIHAPASPPCRPPDP